MKIKVLSDGVVSKIAAGEVVERPSSVVRELVDNAVDASATRIDIDIERGGRSLIAVTDDGTGMLRDDAVLAFERHATSKLREAQDLHSVLTRGFRGEALPSIASVSRMSLMTRAREAEVGTEVQFDGGVLKSVKAQPSPYGTRVEVRHLFFNVPARKKFLKSDKVEESKIKSWLLRSAIATPHVRYRLSFDGHEACVLPERPSMIERARSVFKGSVIPFEERHHEILCVGLVGHPALAQTEAESFVIFVNGRLISDRPILRAVKEGFHSTLKEREFPLGFINVALAPSLVDVNVHPQKSEVRFVDSGKVYQAVMNSVRGAVSSFSRPFWGPSKASLSSGRPDTSASIHVRPRAEVETYSPQTFSFQAIPKHPLGDRVEESAPFLPGPLHTSSSVSLQVPNEQNSAHENLEDLEYSATSISEVGARPPVEHTDQEFRYQDLRYLGQTLGCFLLCELRDTFYVIDMHAAHERVNYNRIREQLAKKEFKSQGLLIPVVVNLEGELLGGLNEKLPLLEAAGFDVESFGEGSVVVRSIPQYLSSSSVEPLVKEVAAYGPRAVVERMDYIAARLACHASVRTGDSITREEVYALLGFHEPSFAH